MFINFQCKNLKNFVVFIDRTQIRPPVLVNTRELVIFQIKQELTKLNFV